MHLKELEWKIGNKFQGKGMWIDLLEETFDLKLFYILFESSNSVLCMESIYYVEAHRKAWVGGIPIFISNVSPLIGKRMRVSLFVVLIEKFKYKYQGAHELRSQKYGLGWLLS